MSLSPQQLFAVLTPAPQFVATLAEAGPTGPQGPPGAHGTPTTIADEGVSLAPYDILNFLGAGVTAAVDAPNNRINVTIPGGGAVDSVFGRTGVVVAANGDYTAAMVTGAVPDTRQVIAGAGMTGGGALSGNVTLNANISGIQTPWLSNINADGWQLNGAGRIESASPQATLTNDGGPGITIREVLRSGANGGNLAYSPRLGFYWNGLAAVQIGGDAANGIRTYDYPGTGFAPFSCAALTANGDVNITGVYRINGVAQGQTPWTQSINAAGWNLTGAGFIELAAPAAIVDVNGAGVTIREALRGGFSGGAIEYSPRIAFQWLSVGTAQLGMSNDGTQTLRTFTSAGTAYAPFAAEKITANNGLDVTTGTIRLFLGGSLKTLSVDGSGFVKAA